MAETTAIVPGIVDRFEGKRIGVLGDLMLDRYLRGRASRLSPEAPVPVVDVVEEQEHPGGAANVATNLATLGVESLLFGTIGSDRAAGSLTDALLRRDIGTEGLVVDTNRPTTVKTRVIANGQHIVRADREQCDEISDDTALSLLGQLEASIGSLDALILQDYNKGTLSTRLIEKAIGLAARHEVPVLVDPKRTNFFAFQGATLFKPNRPETEQALDRTIGDRELASEAAEELRSRLAAENVVVTLGDQGMVLASESAPFHVPTTALEVADVSGAGDTVIATLAAGFAAELPAALSVRLANTAAGIVCGHVGTVPIKAEDLRQAIGQLADKSPALTTDTGL